MKLHLFDFFPDHVQSYAHSYFHAPVLLAMFFALVAVRNLWSPLRSVPGPFLARFTRLWEVYAVRKYDFATYNSRLHKKYGPIVRLAPNRYSINDAEGARTILGHREALDKSDFYYAIGDPHMYNLFSEPSKAANAKLRRPIAHLYTMSQLLSYEAAIDTCTGLLLDRLHTYAQATKRLDVRDLMQQYAFDVIGEITVGSQFGLMRDGGDKNGVIEAMANTLKYGAVVGLVPVIHWWAGKLGHLLRIEPSFGRVTRFVTFHIDNRSSGLVKPPDDRQDFLRKLLQLEAKGKITRRDTFNACLSNIAVGSDTMAIALSSVIAYLCLHPAHLATLRDELNMAAARGELSDPASYNEAKRLPFLRAIINEALRIHPVVGQPMVRVIGEGGAHIAGRYFPPGTEVGVNPWVIHKNTAIFGHDAPEFRPERWLTKNSREARALDENFLAFGAGPRSCIGKNISLLEMYKVIPQIARKFDFEIQTDKKSGRQLTWNTAWFVKPSFTCLVRKIA